MITLQQFAQAAGCGQLTAATWHPHFIAALAPWGIDKSLRHVAGFLAHTSHESGHFARVEENLNYSAQRLMAVWPRRFPTLQRAQHFAHNPEELANEVYGGRMGNGPAASGDGWRNRGRGLIQLTGADNYRAYFAAVGLPDDADRDMILLPHYAADSAGWFWSRAGCNDLMDADDFDGTTQRINGGQVGAKERRALYDQALRVFGVA